MKTMKTGRPVLNVFERDVPKSNDETFTAEASVTNEVEGVCPKCGKSMSIGRIPSHQVYWCGSCRVTTPISES